MTSAAKRWSAMHFGTAARVALIALTAWGVHRHRVSATPAARPETLAVRDVAPFFPRAASLRWNADLRCWEVLDARGGSLGFAWQTAPEGNAAIGFSGPTNALVAADTQRRVLGVAVLASGDTPDHVAAVRRDDRFLLALRGVAIDELPQRLSRIRAVSGATLTSLALLEAIGLKLAGRSVSLKFPAQVRVEEIRRWFPEAAEVTPRAGVPGWLIVGDSQGRRLGTVLCTSPYADNIVGYQGPTECLLALDAQRRIIGWALRRSYDNEPYVGYVRDDAYFPEWLKGRTLESLAAADLEREQVEGVSGATITSLTVAEGLIVAARGALRRLETAMQDADRRQAAWRGAVGATDMVTLAALVFVAATSVVRSLRKRLAVVRSLVVILAIGLVGGHVLSQAQLVGWVQHGIPRRAVAGLAALALIAFGSTLIAGRNVYCAKLCAHGAVQQLLARLPLPKVRVPRPWQRGLSVLPALLLVTVVLAARGWVSVPLVYLEPFDGYAWHVAGAVSLSLLAGTLLFSAFVPLGYCRFGCPTGRLLELTRRRRWRLGADDVLLVCCAVLAWL